jgi:asparagine synthase (glutamine-hydrolysing)
MPGIVGLITKMPRGWAEPQLRTMIDALRHETIYVAGASIDEPSGAYVGWTARKNSFSDYMPLYNECGDISLVFSGEEFPEPGTARRLKENGHSITANGASYLVHLYEENPSAFPAGLNGRFHGILTDRTRATTTLFNDRFGLQRIYYHESKDAFYFAAEAKAILAVRPELRSVDARALGELIACGCVMEDRTVFAGIHVLPPASAWIFRSGSIERKEFYFQPHGWENQSALEPEVYYQQLKETFSRILPRYFNGQEPIGMSLTGGLDTRMVMAWDKSPHGSLPCYSFGGPYRECQDVTIAREVAELCGQSHQVIPVGQDFLSRFARYAERAVYLSDGCADVNRASDLYLNERAREIAPVRMTGNYGSEVLRRTKPHLPQAPTPAFKPVDPLPGLFRPEIVSQIGIAKQTYAHALDANAASFAVFRQAPWHHYGLLTLEETQVGVRTPFLDNDLVQLVFRAPQSALVSSDVCLRLISDGNTDLRRILSDRGLGGDHGRMLTSIARGYLEFTFKAEYAYDYGMPQKVARIDHLFSFLHFERLFLGRHKFVHYRVWYRDALSKYVREMLLDPISLSRPYLEKNSVEMIVEGHLKGNRNYTTEIHKLLTLELISRLFIDSN